MRQEILESISRMTKDDLIDVATTFGLSSSSRAHVRKMALADEDIAEYVLMY